MRNRRISMAIRIVTMIMIVAILMPVGASAAAAETVQPRASYYLDSYNAYIYRAGSGKIQACFSVIGTDYMDEIGALRIAIYESKDNSTWTWVKTYTDDNTPGLLDYDDFIHTGYVTYQGVIGRYYKAYVCVWAGKDGEGDTRYFWTSAKKATLFAE